MLHSTCMCRHIAKVISNDIINHLAHLDHEHVCDRVTVCIVLT